MAAGTLMDTAQLNSPDSSPPPSTFKREPINVKAEISKAAEHPFVSLAKLASLLISLALFWPALALCAFAVLCWSAIDTLMRTLARVFPALSYPASKAGDKKAALLAHSPSREAGVVEGERKDGEQAITEAAAPLEALAAAIHGTAASSSASAAEEEKAISPAPFELVEPVTPETGLSTGATTTVSQVEGVVGEHGDEETHAEGDSSSSNSSSSSSSSSSSEGVEVKSEPGTGPETGTGAEDSSIGGLAGKRSGSYNKVVPCDEVALKHAGEEGTESSPAKAKNPVLKKMKELGPKLKAKMKEMKSS